MVKVNLQPYITAHPAALRKWMALPDSADLREANALRIKDELPKVEVCVAAWGAILTHEEVQSSLWGIYYKGATVTEIDWKCLGLTAAGAPKHTLARGRHRIPDDAALFDLNFDFEDTYV